jgi:hypothetical protein
LLSSIQRLAELMDAETIDAAPVLSSGSLDAAAQAENAGVTPQVDADARRQPAPG